MPFDGVPILDPSVRELPPRERLEWLKGQLDEPGHWYYTRFNSCALGLYRRTAQREPDEAEFGISHDAWYAIFISAGRHVPRRFRWLRGPKYHHQVTPQDVATVIDKVLAGEII